MTAPVEQGLRAVYLATPLFWLADVALGWNIRVAGLADDTRHVYYLGLTVLGALLWWKPVLTRFVAIVEPAVNFGILVISTWMTLISAADAAFSGQPPEVMTTPRLLSFLLSGSMLSLAIHNAISRLRP